MIAVVIPSYKCKKHILGVLSEIVPSVSKIYVVDDRCPENTGKYVAENCKDPRVQVLFHEFNQGVGGAVMTGYAQALADECAIVVKVDGDGQMDPALIPLFVAPIANGEADYAKGNRFNQIENLRKMPPVRIFGNAVLSFFSKLSSGYWKIFDPTNGYTAIHTSVFSQINFKKVSQRYFFESDLLFRLNICGAVVTDIPMVAKYANEKSNLSEFKIIPTFLYGHIKNFGKRIFYNYFLRDFNLASLELIFGIPFVLFGTVYGAYQWYDNYIHGTQAANGTVMLSALPVILGFQMLLGFFGYDISSQPKKSLQSRILKR